MDTNNLQLNENQKIQLDGIVSRMIANKESDGAIQFVVNDFKQKYGSPENSAENKSSFGKGVENVLKDIVGVEKNKSTGIIPSIIRSTYGSQGIGGVAQLPGKTAAAVSEYGLFGIGGAHQAESLNNKASELSNQATDLIIRARAELDPNRKQMMLDNAKLLMKNVDELSNAAKNITDITDTTAKEAIGTSINAGLTAATGGVGSLEKTAGGNLLGKYVSPVFSTLKKGTSAINPTLKALNIGGKIAENAALGAGFNVANNLIEGKPLTEGLSTSALIGGAIPALGTAASKVKTAIMSKVTPTAESLINSLIKPLAKDFSYGKNPARGILNEGIVANSISDLGNQVEAKISSVGQQIGTVGEQLDKAGILLDLTPALKPIDEAINVAAKSNNSTLFQKLNDVKTALMHDLTAGVDSNGIPTIVKGGQKNLIGATYNEAKNFLSDISVHTRFTGNPSDDKALNLATKKAYGITRDLMNKSADSVSPSLGQKIRNLNERYADLLSARNAIAHRDIVLKRQNILNMAEKLSLPIAAGGAIATAIVTGDFAKAGAVLAGELAALIGARFAGSTTAKTRIAQFISRLAPEERQGILNTTPVIKDFYERITGQVSPGENAPKTASLQYAQDYLKNPKLGLSVENITKNITNAEKGTLRDFTDYVNGAYKPDTNTLLNLKRDTQEIVDKYGFSASLKGDKALSRQIAEYLDSVGYDRKIIKENKITNQFSKTESTLIQEAKKYKSAEVKKLGLNPDNIEYHGTGKSFDKFTLGEEGSSGAGTENLGVFTTKSKEAANFWAEKSAGVGKNGKVMEVYLDVKNPKIFKSQQELDDFIGDNPEQAIDKLKKQGFDAIKYPESGIDKFPFDYWDELASKGVSFKNKLPDEPYMTTQVFNPKDVYIINNGDLKSVAKKIKTNNMNFFDKYPDITGYKPEEISLLTTDKYIRRVLEHYSYHNKTTPAETVNIIREQLRQ